MHGRYQVLVGGRSVTVDTAAMQTWRQRGGQEGSVWNLFQGKTNFKDELKDVLDEVVSVRNICYTSRQCLQLDLLQIKEIWKYQYC